MAETWQPPRLRSGQTSKSDRHATWLELFFDLVFVVAVNALAHMLYPELSLHHLVRFGVLYIPVWWAWIGATFYATRFDTDDVLQRVLIFVQMNAVLTLALNIEEGLGATSTVFALAYAIVRGVLVLQYLRAGWSIAAARPLTHRFARGFAFAAAMWLLSAFVPAPWRFALWAVGLIVDIGTPLFAGRLHARFAPDLSHLPERFGLFTVVVLGESIVAVANGVAVQQWNVFSTLTAILGFSIAFCLWWTYFDHASDGAVRAARDHGRVMIYQLCTPICH
jgi:low temperature requirement protein LtrA